MYEEYKEGKITLCDPEEYLDRLVNFICYVRKDMVIERLFSRVPKEDASFSNWGISWWKLKIDLTRSWKQMIICKDVNLTI